jgi:hypothetical protein
MILHSRVDNFNSIIDQRVGGHAVTVIGGRSLGAQAAALVARSRSDIEALVLVSYPLTKNGVFVLMEILAQLNEKIKVLFISGDKDSMCDLEKLEEIRGYMRAKTWLATVEGADHGMKVEIGTEEVGELVGQVAAEWLKSLDEGLLTERETEGTIWWDKEEALWSGWENAEAMSRKDAEVEKTGNDTTMKPVRKGTRSKKFVDSEDVTDVDAGKDTQEAESSKAKKPVKRSTKAKQVDVVESEEDTHFDKAETSKAMKTTKKPAKNTAKTNQVAEVEDSLDLLELSGEDAEWEVEDIVDHTQDQNGRKYLVKWKGWPENESTWEWAYPNLINAQEILESYLKSHGLPPLDEPDFDQADGSNAEATTKKPAKKSAESKHVAESEEDADFDEAENSKAKKEAKEPAKKTAKCKRTKESEDDADYNPGKRQRRKA